MIVWRFTYCLIGSEGHRAIIRERYFANRPSFDDIFKTYPLNNSKIQEMLNNGQAEWASRIIRLEEINVVENQNEIL